MYMIHQQSRVSILVLLLLCVALHAQVPPAAPKSSEELTTGNISGRVVNESGQPLAGAALFVRALNSGIAVRSTTADAEGNFRVNGLDAGLYIVSANSAAYTTTPADPTAPPTYYRIGDSVRLELIRGGIITGAVTNALGEPLIDVRVRAIMVRDAKGEILKMPSFGYREDQTDDRGIYRIYGLLPGAYLLAAGAFGFSSGMVGPYDLDVPTYAPSSTRDNAAEVSVRGGEESTMDIRYRGEPGHTVSGTVKLAGTGGATITVTPAGNSFIAIGNTFVTPGGRGFAFNGLADGDYDVLAQEFLNSQTSGIPVQLISEPRRITIKGANVTGIELVTRPLPSLSGRIVLESSKVPECQGKRPPLLAETLVRLQRHEKDVEKDRSTYRRTFMSSASPDQNGDFVLRNLMAGRYQFEPRFYARYWYLRSITLGTGIAKSQKTDAASTWTVLKIGEQLSNVTITLAGGAASVRGRSVVADPPAVRAVYLVPAEPDKADDVLRYFVADIAADGAFAFNNLPPGRYWALAQSTEPQTATLAKLRQPEAATARVKFRRTPEAQKSEIQLKPCQNLTDYQLK